MHRLQSLASRSPRPSWNLKQQNRMKAGRTTVLQIAASLPFGVQFAAVGSIMCLFVHLPEAQAPWPLSAALSLIAQNGCDTGSPWHLGHHQKQLRRNSSCRMVPNIPDCSPASQALPSARPVACLCFCFMPDLMWSGSCHQAACGRSYKTYIPGTLPTQLCSQGVVWWQAGIAWWLGHS